MSAILKDELANDPLGRGYDGMTDQELVDSLNVADRQRNRTSMSGDEVFANVASRADWDNLTDSQRLEFLGLCGRETINPFAGANVELVKSIFGNGSATVSNLAAARVETVSRAVEIGLGRIALKTLKLQSIR